MKPNHPKNTPSDFDADIEGDALWRLLDESSPLSPSPRFHQDTLRRVRLDQAEQKPSWWQSLLSPKPLMGLAGAALAAVAIVIAFPADSGPVSDPIADKDPTIEEAMELQAMEDSLATELLSAAAEDPSLLSDEEIVSLIY